MYLLYLLSVGIHEKQFDVIPEFVVYIAHNFKLYLISI